MVCVWAESQVTPGWVKGSRKTGKEPVEQATHWLVFGEKSQKSLYEETVAGQEQFEKLLF